MLVWTDPTERTDMDQRVITDMFQAPTIDHILIGAYGYLSAMVDSHVHSPESTKEQLHREFAELQAIVAHAMTRYFDALGMDRHAIVDEVAKYASDKGVQGEGLYLVRQRMVRLLFPVTPVTEK